MTFIEEGNPDFLERESDGPQGILKNNETHPIPEENSISPEKKRNTVKMINIDKRKLFHSIIETIQQYQMVHYNIQRVPQIVHFLQNMKTFTEKDLYECSLECEPRGCDKSAILI